MPNSNNYPNTAIDALTMLFLSKTDISNLSPSELVTKYNSVYKEISKSYNNTQSERNTYL